MSLKRIMYTYDLLFSG